MEDITISLEEMIDYIYEKIKNTEPSISKYTISLILDFEEEFLDSKGLIQIEED